jgi:hypothetical protein
MQPISLSSTLATTTTSPPPAGGAAIGQIVIATLFAGLGAAILARVVSLHRQGRTELLANAAAFSERVGGIPGWAALPLGVCTVSLLSAFFGVYWDIAFHIDNGRDPGPLANPAHYFILLGLFGIFAAGYLAISLPRDGERPGPAAVRIAGNWHAPVGGILIFLCGTFALMGFPLDDLWHRLFGQDVTLWGPTHLVMIGGAVMTLLGMAVLISEGMAERRARGAVGPPPLLARARKVGLAGGLLIGLSAFQAEFDFGVPQFRLIFEPMLLAFAAGFALVTARVWIGRGGALGAVAFFLVARGIIALLVGDVFGKSVPHFPLYAVEALCVEAAGLIVGRRRPLVLGAIAGAGIGSLGFGAEWAWSHAWMPVPWTADIWPQGLVVAVIAGVAGGLAGGVFASALRGTMPSRTAARASFAGSLVTLLALGAFALQTSAPQGVRAAVTLHQTSPAPAREAIATVRLQPRNAADGASWIQETGWQGGGLVQAPLERISEGVYRTPEPLPLHGDWKSLIRLARGNEIAGIPVYMPADPAIPVGGVAAPHRFTRTFVPDHQILQREQKQDLPGWLWPAAALVVLALTLAFISLLALGAGYAGRRFTRPPDAVRRPERPAQRRRLARSGRVIGASRQ